jgi:hypothetical protein
MKPTCSNQGCVERNSKIFKRRPTTEQDLRVVVRWCERSIIYRLAEKTGNDAAETTVLLIVMITRTYSMSIVTLTEVVLGAGLSYATILSLPFLERAVDRLQG